MTTPNTSIDGQQLSFDDVVTELAAPRRGRLRRDARETSVQAAHDVTLRTGSSRVHILWFIGDAAASAQGLTDDEIRKVAHAAGVRLAWSTTSARRGELVKAGLVEDSGLTRPAHQSGQPAVVWRITETGQAALRKLGLVAA